MCQVWFPCLTHVSTSPPPPPGGPYLVLTLVCPAPFPTPDSGFPAAHVTAGIGWSYGRSARSDFPYKRLQGTYSSVVPVDHWRFTHPFQDIQFWLLTMVINSSSCGAWRYNPSPIHPVARAASAVRSSLCGLLYIQLWLLTMGINRSSRGVCIVLAAPLYFICVTDLYSVEPWRPVKPYRRRPRVLPVTYGSSACRL